MPAHLVAPTPPLSSGSRTKPILWTASTGAATGAQEYQPVLLEIDALKLPRLNLGYASEYDGLIRVMRIRKMALPDPEDACFVTIRISLLAIRYSQHYAPNCRNPSSRNQFFALNPGFEAAFSERRIANGE
ncbi:MAG: hypothetical protein H6556_07245 [Lewinellaceae bacterium]|nr:hypothetical protein [Lewinellaceae bacterium]